MTAATASAVQWVTGAGATAIREANYEAEPMAKYVVIVRGGNDPKRLTRKERQERFGNTEAATKWKADLKDDKRWRRLLLEVFAGVADPITFNAAVLTASGFEYSADAAFEKAPERALWWLVDGGLIEHTLESPIRFRITDDGRKLRAHVHDEEERTERMSERRKPDPFLRACGELERTLEGLTEEDAAIAIRRALYPLSPGVEKAVAVIRRVMNRHHTDDRTRRRLKSFIESHVDWEVLRTQEEQNSPEGGE